MLEWLQITHLEQMRAGGETKRCEQNGGSSRRAPCSTARRCWGWRVAAPALDATAVQLGGNCPQRLTGKLPQDRLDQHITLCGGGQQPRRQPLRIIDHFLQLNGARFVHLDPAPVPIDAKTRSAFQLVGIDATGCLAPDQPRSLRLGHQSIQIRFFLAVALGQHAQPSCNLRLGLLEFLVQQAVNAGSFSTFWQGFSAAKAGHARVANKIGNAARIMP